MRLEPHISYSSPSINRIIKSMRMRLIGHAARMRRRAMYIRFRRESQKEKALKSPTFTWERNVRVNLEWDDIDWIHMAHYETSGGLF
jgi:hypothetical protein